jgi:hypothetical protein
MLVNTHTNQMVSEMLNRPATAADMADVKQRLTEILSKL